MTTDNRWIEWLHAAKERAESMRQLTPLAEYRPRRMRATEPSAPSWYEPAPYRAVVQDAPNLITGIIARRNKPTKLFRSFHGKGVDNAA